MKGNTSIVFDEGYKKELGEKLVECKLKNQHEFGRFTSKS